MDRLARKHRAARDAVPAAVIETRAGRDVRRRHRRRLRSRRARGARASSSAHGIRADYMRIRGFPFGEDVEAFLARARAHLRRRAEPRRAAALAPHARDGGRRRTSSARCSPTAASRSRRRRSSTAIVRRRSRDAAETAHELHQEAGRPAPVARSRTSSASRCATTKARCRRSAPAAATTRSPPPSSARSTSSTSPPHMVAKLSGIGCSSKTPTYFLVGRARLQLGARPHAGDRHRRRGRQPRPHLHRRQRRRRLALDRPRPDVPRHPPQRRTCSTSSRTTASTASPRASSRRRPTSARSRRRARPTPSRRSTRSTLALSLGATFVARSFSGDKAQLVPILKAGLTHNGFALVDVISPCVTFNDHEGSTKSYSLHPQAPACRSSRPTSCPRARGDHRRLRRGDGDRASRCTTAASCASRRSPTGYDPSDRDAVVAYLAAASRARASIPTGLLFLDPKGVEMHAAAKTVDTPLSPSRSKSSAPAPPRSTISKPPTGSQPRIAGFFHSVIDSVTCSRSSGGRSGRQSCCSG